MDTQKAKKIIEDIFSLMAVAVETIEYQLDEKRGHIFVVKSLELENLTKENESLIRDLVYLIKKIFGHSFDTGEGAIKCTIDINDAQSKADAHIKMKALNAAEEAKNLKTDITLEPMSSYDRMVIHSTLADMADISTESVGEGKERRIMVKYLAI